MSNLKILPINIQVNETAENTPKMVWWKRLGVMLGLMKNENEPSINGGMIVVTIALIILVMYLFFGWAVNWLDQKDEQRAKEMLLKTAARRADERTTREQDKRAELLELLKKEGVYEKIPEPLKTFEQAESDKQLIKEEKK